MEEKGNGAAGGVSRAGKGTILLLDDDKFLVDMYGLKFSNAGYSVQICLSGKDALQLLRDGLKPSAILFDITMPEMDGFEFMQQLVSEHLAANALKIALTNQNDEAEKDRAAKLGVVRYIVKASAIPSEVVNIVGEELGKHTTSD